MANILHVGDEFTDPDMPELEEVDRHDIQEYVDSRSVDHTNYELQDYSSIDHDFFEHKYFSMETIFGSANIDNAFAGEPHGSYELFNLADVEYNNGFDDDTIEEEQGRGRHILHVVTTNSLISFT